jgi:predicted HTH domain antitoxin
MSQVVIEVPDDLFLVLREQPGEFAQAARLAVAIYYLREKRLSLGQAARLAGLTRPDFLDALAAHGLPAFDLTAADAIAEVAAAQRPTTHDGQ